MIALAAAHLLPKFTPAGHEPITAWRQLQVIMGKVSLLCIESAGSLWCLVYGYLELWSNTIDNYNNYFVSK